MYRLQRLQDKEALILRSYFRAISNSFHDMENKEKAICVDPIINQMLAFRNQCRLRAGILSLHAGCRPRGSCQRSGLIEELCAWMTGETANIQQRTVLLPRQRAFPQLLRRPLWTSNLVFLAAAFPVQQGLYGGEIIVPGG